MLPLGNCILISSGNMRDSLKKKPIFLRAMYLSGAFPVLREEQDRQDPASEVRAEEDWHLPAESEHISTAVSFNVKTIIFTENILFINQTSPQAVLLLLFC